MSKGQFDLGRKALYMIVVVFVLIFVFFYMSALMNNYYAETVVDSDRMSTELIASNLLISPNCLAYTEKSIPRAYLGVIDLEKFTDNIDSCLPYSDRPFKVSVAGKSLNFGLKEGQKSYKIERLVLVKNSTGMFPSVFVLEDGYVR